MTPNQQFIIQLLQTILTPIVTIIGGYIAVRYTANHTQAVGEKVDKLEQVVQDGIKSTVNRIEANQREVKIELQAEDTAKQ